MGNALLIGNIFVVFTDLCFCGWCVDWLRQFVRFYQPFRKFDAAYCAVLLIACPAASCNITTDDTLDREHIQLFTHHAVAVKLRLLEKLRHIFYISGNHVVWKDIFCHIKPESGHLSQYSALLCDRIIQDHIKAADTVSSDHDQAVTVIIDFTYFSFFNRFHFTYLAS